MEQENKKIDRFCHLHVHSTYSFQDGIGLPEQYIKRAKELGQPGLGVTDHGNISAHYKWYKNCKKEGITPILGCEFYIVENDKEIKERGYNHITVLVKNNIGYKNLTKLVTKAWCEQFYYKPRITFKDLFEHQEGLIVLSGCLSSPVMEILKGDSGFEMDLAEDNLELFKKNIEDFYIEFQPIGFEEGKFVYEKLIKLYNERLKEKGFKAVVTNDCHYVKKEQSKLQEILLCIQTRDTIDNPKHWKFDQDDFYLKSREEMEQSLKQCFPEEDFTDALDATVKIAESIDFEFPKATPIKFPMPEEEKVKYLYKMCNEGMVKRGLYYNSKEKKQKLGFEKENEGSYKERLEYELDLIVKKGFIDYFLVIADLVQWAKSKNILVGPARGSSAGSIACYALEITEVEPIRWGLIFERFIDLNREDLPDIDIDFEDARRHEIKKYLEEKYGRDRVGNLPTFSAFKGKSAIDDIARVFKIPFKVTEQVKNAIIERSGGDSRASFTLEDTFISDVFTYPKEAMEKYPELKYAIEIEGQYRQIGQHAAGVVISNEPLTDFCAIYKIKDEYVISMDYKDASETGLLKIDILGLNTLSVISNAMKLIKERTKKEIDIYSLPLDDPKVYKSFIDGKLFGIFQFDGQAVNQVCRQIAPRDFESLSAISALARPGPLNSGNTTEYIQRRDKKKKVKFVHPAMKNITGDSYGIVIYQEQIMKVMREIGKMSWKDTAEIRKLISRSQGVEKFNTFKEKFIPGAIENDINIDIAEKMWEEMCHYGSWSFNKSHSVSYTIISYWTMWLKVHYPMEFYGSILSLTEKEEKKKKIIKEYKKEGFKVLPIDINKSKKHFTIEKEGLRIGIADIKGVGEMTASSIVKRQPYYSYTDFETRTKGKRVSDVLKQNLVDLGAFDDLGNGACAETLFGDTILEYEKKEMDFSEHFRICPWNIEFGIDNKWLQFLKDHPEKFKNLPVPIAQLKEMDESEDSVIYGVVYDKNLRDAREVSLSKGKTLDLSKYNGQYQFANFTLEDDTDFVTVRLSHKAFPEYGNLIFEKTKADDVIIMKGRIGSGIRMFFCNKMLNLRLYKESLEKNETEK